MNSFALNKIFYVYTKVVITFVRSGCVYLVCHTHRKIAKLGVVKDKMNMTTVA